MTPTRNARIPAIRPNWGSSVVVSYEFKTDIFTSFNGTERREAVRAEPRVTLDFNALLFSWRKQRHMNDLAFSQDKAFKTPAPWRWASVASSSGSTFAFPGNAPFWAQADAELVVLSLDTEQIVTVASVAGDTVTLTAAPTYEIKPGDIVSPALPSRLGAAEKFKAITDDLLSGGVTFEADPASLKQSFFAFTPDQENGIDVAPWAPNWANGLDLQFSSMRRTFDPGLGAIYSDNPRGYSQRVMQASFLLMSKEEVERFVAFFFQKRGRRGTFRIDLGLTEMRASAPAAIGATQVEFEGRDLFDAAGSNPTYTTLRAITASGEQANVITGSALTGEGNTLLTFADPWTVAIDQNTRICWWHVWRWATDRLEINWLTDEVAEVDTSFQAVIGEG